MGWFRDEAPGHEGYLIAVVRVTAENADGIVLRSWYRELTGLVRDAEAQRMYDGARISIVQVACECGWRSMRLQAPAGTTWRPLSVRLPAYDEEAFEDFAAGLWSAHVREHGDVDLWDFADGPGPVAHVTTKSAARLLGRPSFELVQRARRAGAAR